MSWKIQYLERPAEVPVGHPLLQILQIQLWWSQSNRYLNTWMTLYWSLKNYFYWIIVWFGSKNTHWRLVKSSPKKPWLPRYCLENCPLWHSRISILLSSRFVLYYELCNLVSVTRELSQSQAYSLSKARFWSPCYMLSLTPFYIHPQHYFSLFFCFHF